MAVICQSWLYLQPLAAHGAEARIWQFAADLRLPKLKIIIAILAPLASLCLFAEGGDNSIISHAIWDGAGFACASPRLPQRGKVGLLLLDQGGGFG
jgi:hypothetical protein